MRNCLILGSGRSGTSMLGGILHRSGYHLGRKLWPAREANPKGFFEDEAINAINEDILAEVESRRLAAGHPEARLDFGQRWLQAVPLGTPIPDPSPELAGRIREETAIQPHAFKDPRFCYTLPAWRPFLGDAGFLCIFREPGRTVQSILQEVAEQPYLEGLTLSEDSAFEVWTLMYRHVLEVHRPRGSWLFVHFDQLLDGSAFSRLEEFLGSSLDRAFSDPALKRSPDRGAVPPEAERVYADLCELAATDGALRP